MKTWRIWGIVSVMVVAGTAWAEDVTLTGYVPAPRLVGDEMVFKTAKDYDNAVYKVDPDQTSKLNILDVNTLNNLGNLKITGSVYVQSQPTAPPFPYGLGLKVENATTTLTGSAVINQTTNLGATQALKVTGRGAGQIAADIGTGLTKITGAATVDKTTNVSATEVLKVTGSGGTVAVKVDGGGMANTGLLVTSGQTKLEQKTTIGTAPVAAVILEVFGQSVFHEDVILKKVLKLEGNPLGLDVVHDAKIRGKLTVEGDAHFKNLTVEDYVNLVGPSTHLSTSIQTIGSIVAQNNVTAQKFIDYDDPMFLVDPNGDSKLKNLELTGTFTVNDLDVKGKILNSTGNPVKVEGNLLVTGTSDFRGAIGNNGGASPLVVSSTINLAAGHDLVATNGSSTSFVGGGGGNLGVGTISGGAHAGAECSGGVCHLQVGGGGGSVDFDSAGGVNFTATGGNAIFGAGSTLNITNGNFTANDPGTTAAATAKVLTQSGSKAEWQTLPAAPAAYAPSQFCFTSVRNAGLGGSCNVGEMGVTLASTEKLCFDNSTTNCGP